MLSICTDFRKPNRLLATSPTSRTHLPLRHRIAPLPAPTASTSAGGIGHAFAAGAVPRIQMELTWASTAVHWVLLARRSPPNRRVFFKHESGFPLRDSRQAQAGKACPAALCQSVTVLHISTTEDDQPAGISGHISSPSHFCQATHHTPPLPLPHDRVGPLRPQAPMMKRVKFSNQVLRAIRWHKPSDL